MSYCSKCGAHISERFCSVCGNDCQDFAQNPHELNTQETLDALYTLRAGLSTISMNYDRINTIKEEEIQNNCAIISSKEKINTYRKNILSQKREHHAQTHAQNKCLSKCSQIDNELEEIEKEIGKIKEKINIIESDNKNILQSKKYKQANFLFKLFLTISILCFIFYFITIIINSNLFVIGITSTILFIFLSLVFYMLKPKLKDTVLINEALEIERNKKSLLIQEKTDYKYKLYKERQPIQNYELSLSQLENKILENENKIKLYEQKFNNLENETKNLSINSKRLLSALEQNFKNLLSVQDWDDLDMIIYFLETNRAKNIQEALQQMDTHKRHQELVSVAKEATKVICSTIATCAARLSYQLDTISENQEKISNKIDNSINTLNESIISSAQMQEALLKKSNETSQQLMSDVRRMKEYATEAYMKNRTL